MLNNREHYILLLDYYGELLTNHQIEILNEYLNEDLSMNEIADNYKISKSAVQDLIKRSFNQLEDYDKAVQMIKKDEKLDLILDEMEKENNPVLDKYIKKIKKIK